MPTRENVDLGPMSNEVYSLFAKFWEKDTIKVLYPTKVCSIRI